MKAKASSVLSLRSTPFRYGLALVLTALALLVRHYLDPVLGNYTPYITLYPVIVVLAIYVGLGPSIVATFVGLLGAIDWFVPPRHSFAVWSDQAQLVGTLVFLVVCYFFLEAGEISRRWKAKLANTQEESARRASAELEAMTRLHEVGARCMRAGNAFQECLDAILETAISLTEADKGNLQVFDPFSGALVIAAQRGFEPKFLEFFAAVREEACACGAAFQSAQRVIVEDVKTSPLFAGRDAREVLLESGVQAVQSFPLLSSAGSVLGMISIHLVCPISRANGNCG